MKRWAMVLLVAGPAVLRAEPPASVEMGDDFPPVQISSGPALTSTAPTPAPGAALRVVHPPEGASLPYVKSSFVLGSVDPGSRLSIDGQSIRVYPGGGWIAMVSYTPGANDIEFEVTRGTDVFTFTRRVYVAGPPGVPPVKPLNVRVLTPDVDAEVTAGDVITVTAVGSPGQEAGFVFSGSKKKHPLAESAVSRGTYRGSYVVRPGDEFEGASIKVTLTAKNGAHDTSTAPGKIWRFDEESPWVVEVSTDLAILRAASAPFPGEKAGYVMFPPPGTRLWVTGRRGNELRVRLSAAREAWIGADEVRFLPSGTPPPRTLAGAVSVEPAGRHTVVRMNLGQRVPMEVRPLDDGAGLDVLFYGVASNTDWVHYNAPQGAVRRVEWFQDDADTYRLRIHTRSRLWWGYDARYENSTFVLELRRPPPGPKDGSLEGLKIVVDAGHSWDIGSRGPTGLLEKDANLAIAKCLERKLRSEKAEVVMLRSGTENVNLYDRPKLAWAARGDVLISVHNNALPDGANPFERNGYGVYYYHPQSEDLATEIHEAYGDIFGRAQAFRSTHLRDDGLHYGNLALARTSQMPAVLTESAYVIWPPEEELLKTETFQCDCAEAMFRGLKRFVKKMRD
ncbi:MAG TPA: N-acetylmuramoyl-L-alanine amidase [Elusimicrobiota bacterium]|nr:N-acetylmuramoyl-L-alanine amidase [Elusimicrobiota bacterium]